MHVWNVLHAAGLKYRTQKLRKNSHLRTIAQSCRAISSQLRHVGLSTVWKNLTAISLPHVIMSQYGELRPTDGWDRLANFGHTSKFQLVSRFGFVTAPTPLNGGQPNFAGCLAVSWAGTLYIGWQWRNFFILYLCQLFFRHVVGQALQNVSYSDITFFVR